MPSSGVFTRPLRAAGKTVQKAEQRAPDICASIEVALDSLAKEWHRFSSCSKLSWTFLVVIGVYRRRAPK